MGGIINKSLFLHNFMLTLTFLQATLRSLNLETKTRDKMRLKEVHLSSYGKTVS